MGLEGIVSKRLGSRYNSGRTRGWLKFKNPEAPASEGSRECPLSWDLNVVERVSIADRPTPWVVNFPAGKPEDRRHHTDHSERAPNGYYA